LLLLGCATNVIEGLVVGPNFQREREREREEREREERGRPEERLLKCPFTHSMATCWNLGLVQHDVHSIKEPDWDF
jgi:hypothetical protein